MKTKKIMLSSLFVLLSFWGTGAFAFSYQDIIRTEIDSALGYQTSNTELKIDISKSINEITKMVGRHNDTDAAFGSKPPTVYVAKELLKANITESELDSIKKKVRHEAIHYDFYKKYSTLAENEQMNDVQEGYVLFISILHNSKNTNNFVIADSAKPYLREVFKLIGLHDFSMKDITTDNLKKISDALQAKNIESQLPYESTGNAPSNPVNNRNINLKKIEIVR